MSLIVTGIGNVFTKLLNFMIARMVLFGSEKTGVSQMVAIILGEIQVFVWTKTWLVSRNCRYSKFINQIDYFFFKKLQIRLLALSTAIGCTAYLVMKHHVQDIGRVGMELQQNSTVLEGYFTMKIRMHAIGLKMLEGARSIHCVKMTPMVMFLLEDLVIDTGPARVDIQDCRGVLQCWFSTKHESAVSLHQQRIVIYLRQQLLLRRLKKKIGLIKFLIIDDVTNFLLLAIVKIYHSNFQMVPYQADSKFWNSCYN